MNAEKIITAAKAKEISTNSDSLPEDINLEKRKTIMHEQLRKLLGRSLTEKEIIENRRLKTVKFKREKTRKKIAQASRRRNRV